MFLQLPWLLHQFLMGITVGPKCWGHAFVVVYMATSSPPAQLHQDHILVTACSAQKKVVACVYGKSVDSGTKCADSDKENVYIGASLHSGSVDTVVIHRRSGQVNPNPLMCGSVDRATADAKAKVVS